MCGIAGIVAAEARDYQSNLERMVTALGHRGPDGSGTHFFDRCALGHTRLSIVDLCTGQQPMLSERSPIGITFNGEIYGYKSLKASLDGYQFRTTSDTEVILAMYEQDGARLLSRLPGMYAFAIWDDARQELLCARDRFGEKPFYYAFGPRNEFVFASEIKALLASGLIRPILSLEAVTHYLKYLYVHPHQTIYQNVHTLPPAHALRLRDGRVSIERYWRPPVLSHNIEVTEAAAEMERLLDGAVERQLVADVPVGAFLSGGLDSSTIVALASRHQARLMTLSFGFEDSASELPFARQVAELYETEHIELEDKEADIGDLLTQMQDIYDEPFADSSNIPTYLISKLARQHVKVVLTGDGGDEMLGGYSSWYKPLLNMQSGSSDLVFHLFRLANKVSNRAGRSLEVALHSQIQGGDYRRRYGSVSVAHAAQKQYFSHRELARIGLDTYAAGPVFAPFSDQPSNTVDDALRMDIEDYMPGDILVKTDRASMANGLELRAPFLDIDFASFCISLPSRLKINREQDKIILRRAFAGYWPESVQKRGKQGFGAPVAQWLKKDSVRALKERFLNDPGQKLFSILSFAQTRDAVSRDDYQTWTLLVLSMWLSKHEFDLA